VEQPDEIGRLAEVLEETRRRLRESIGATTALNRQLEQRVRQRTRDLELSNRHLKAVMTVATLANAARDRAEVLSEGIAVLVDTLAASSGWAFLYDERQRSLRLVANHRLPESMQKMEMTVTSAEATCLRAIEGNKVVCERVSRCRSLPAHVRAEARGVLCWSVPIRAGERPLGLLCVASRPEHAIPREGPALMQAVAQQLAVAFQNAQLAEERARLEASRQLEMLRAEFIASISHELRTPLGFIKGYTTTLLREDVRWKPSQRREFLEIVDEESDHLAELVDSLLDVARAQAGQLRLRIQDVSLEKVFRDATERLNGSLQRDRVTFAVAPTPLVPGDAARLRQVALNLLQNAVKYSPEGGPIHITIEAEDETVRVGVFDRGVGLAPDQADSIFEPFYRVQGELSTRVGGAGLGLAICRAVIDAHGGRIWAEPRADGGTAVYFTLPTGSS
jgi:two-component system sensor histidine kinase KdpD